MKEIMDFINGDTGDNNECCGCTCIDRLPLAYSYTPFQELDSVYEYCEALKNGTVFPELNLPLDVYGKNFCKREGM